MSTRINDSQMQDFTAAINKVPRAWNIFDELDMIETFGVATETASVDVISEKTNTFGDVRRGGPRTNVEAETSITKALTIPFFSLDGAVRPSDLQNLRKYGTESDNANVNDAVERIMQRIRRYQTSLRSKAMAEAIQGAAYAPNGTVAAQNYYTVFEQTQKVVDFDLANAATDPIAKAEEVYAHIIDNADDGATQYDVIAWCSPTFFSGLLANDTFALAYTHFQSQVNPLRERTGGNSIGREFTHGGIRYVETRAAFNGVPLIPAGDAYFMPLGIDQMFQQIHAPADHLDYVNTAGQEAYMWIHKDPKGRKVEVESETAFITVNNRPELVVRATLT